MPKCLRDEAVPHGGGDTDAELGGEHLRELGERGGSQRRGPHHIDASGNPAPPGRSPGRRPGEGRPGPSSEGREPCQEVAAVDDLEEHRLGPVLRTPGALTPTERPEAPVGVDLEGRSGGRSGSNSQGRRFGPIRRAPVGGRRFS